MKKGLPKAQKGLAKLVKIVKTANKTSGNVSKKMQAPPIIRKAKSDFHLKGNDKGLVNLISGDSSTPFIVITAASPNFESL